MREISLETWASCNAKFWVHLGDNLQAGKGDPWTQGLDYVQHPENLSRSFHGGADEKLISQGKKSGFESILMGQLSHLKTKHEAEKRIFVSIPEIQAVCTAIFLLKFTQLYGHFLIYR